ncbi:MAG: HNH endonuclease [Rhodanobacteraceae bacterium]|jgi:hypothetical protein|nr:HNH endonuclease [Rhodanobacteraceae bacterium]
MTSLEASIAFYDTHYDILRQWFLRPGDKVVLGDKQNRVCRFCSRKSPEVTFRKVAHAIPEALGNKSIESAYECDDCNEGFGRGIENDLGNWSKPTRTFARIRGKSGVPTLKKGGDGKGWRIEHGAAGFSITSYEDDPLYQIDEVNRRITFQLKRDPYTPVAVLKAFMKIGLTLLPDEEIGNFPHLMSWVRSTDHIRRFADQCPVIRSFQPGPMPNDLIAAFLLRRKSHVTNYPYMFLVLGYGNEVFQVQLPSEQHDLTLNGQPISILPFPTPDSPDPARYGPTRVQVLDLTGREVVKGEVISVQVGYDLAVHKTGSNTTSKD